MKKMFHLPKCVALALGLLAAAATTHAQTNTTWNGSVSANWTDAGNWSAGTPIGGFNAIFNASGSPNANPNQITTLTMDKITLASGGSSFNLQFQGWNVNTADTFLEVASGNTQPQNVYNVRNNGGSIVLKSGTSTILNNGSHANGLFVGSIAAVPNAKLTGASGANSTLVVDGSGTTTIGITGSGTAMPIADGGSGGVLSLTKSGSGTLTLNSANTFSGGVTLQGNGTLNLANSSAAGNGTIFLKHTASGFVGKTLGISGGITVANAISIDSTTGREAITSESTGNNSLTGGITITGAGPNPITINNNQSSGNLTVSGGISGASYANTISLRGSRAGNVGFLNGTVTLAAGSLFDNNGATSWTLNTAGSTWGQTFVRSSGNLILGVNNALATGARVTFDQTTSTGGVDLNGFNQTVAGIETTVTPTSGNGGRVTNNGATDSTLTLTGLTADRTFAGTITDGTTNKTSLVMNSSGRTQTLNGNNTFSGNTTISAGTLLLGSAGSIANSNTINVSTGATFNVAAVSGGFVLGSSQTLMGSGTVTGDTTINGNLQPGASPGVLTMNGTLTLASSATTTMEINGTTRGTQYDGIDISSNALTYGGNLTLSLGTTFGEGNYTFDLFNFSGSQTGSFSNVTLAGAYTGSLTNNSGVWSLTSGVNTWTFTQSTGDLGLTVIPEPTTWAMLGVGLTALVILRRRRRIH